MIAQGRIRLQLKNNNYRDRTMELINLCLFADAKQCNPFTNIIIDTLQGRMRDELLFLDEIHVKSVFRRTCNTAEVPIRRFCIYQEDWDFETVSDLFKSCPNATTEYLNFQANNFTEIYTTSPLKRGAGELYDKCIFHVHRNGDVCSSTINKLDG